jgi:murein DD-endopeptidase MepM/ murein hydrolase activator NlpD
VASPSSSVTRWAPLAEKYGKRFGVPASTLLGLIQVESGGNPHAVSPAGAQGLTQFMPGTAHGYKVKPWDPASSIRGAAQYLSDLGYHKDPRTALAKYNGGPGNPQYSYAKAVLGAASAFGDPTSAPPASVSPSPGTPAAPDPAATLAQTLQRSQGSVSPPSAPAFAAKVQTPIGYQPQPNVSAPPQDDLRQQLMDTLRGPADVPLTAPTVVGDLGSHAGTYGPAPAEGFKGGYPLGKRGQVIGTPYAGTHAKAFNVSGGSDNWQSENAVDIRVPVGTPVYAEADGVLGNTGSLGQGGRFAGLRTNLISKGNAYYYAHLSKLGPGIKAGAHVKRGQLLGYSGAANGVPHLHFAIERGDPRKLVQ